MTHSKDEMVSAQVIIYPANRKLIDGLTGINAQNISDFVPDPKEVSVIIDIFHKKGFISGPFIGISFSISAGKDIFEKFLNIKVMQSKDGGFEFFQEGKNLGRELKDEQLPKILKEYVHAIVFPNPPAFGPKDW